MIKQKLKTYKCKNKGCNNTFEKLTTDLRSWCSPECGYQISMQKLDKKKKEEAKTKKTTLIKKLGKNYQPTKKSLLQIAQDTINSYVRLRDKGKPCISCQRPYNQLKKLNAGHFKSVGGNNSLRFNLWNINLQCEYCNTFKNGNLVAYRENLIKKIGIEKVEFLEAPQQIKKFGDDYYNRIIKIFRKKIKKLKSKEVN